jgi:hypothetical protein
MKGCVVIPQQVEHIVLPENLKRLFIAYVMLMRIAIDRRYDYQVFSSLLLCH